MKLKNAVIIGASLFISSICGVFAAFTYHTNPALPIIMDDLTIDIDDAAFEFGNVPDGEVYGAFVEQAIKDIEKGSTDSVLISNLNTRLNQWFTNFTYFGSMAVTGGNTALDELFEGLSEQEKAEMGKLSFMIESIDSSDKPTSEAKEVSYYNLYLTNVHLGERGTAGSWGGSGDPGQPVAPVDDTQDSVYYHNYIYPIYKVEIREEPEDSGSYKYGDIRLGAARSMWYLENSNNNRTHIPAFDTQSWIEASNDTITGAATYPNNTLNTINFGSNKDNSIWVYAPISTEVSPQETRTTILNMASSDGDIYYKTLFVKGPGGGNYNVTVSLVTPEGSDTKKSIEIFRASDNTSLGSYENDERTSITFEVVEDEVPTAVYYKIKADGPVELVLSKKYANP